MRGRSHAALAAAAAVLALVLLCRPAAATFGDNGLTTYTGRKREPNTLVFGNDMVTQQGLDATLSFAKDVLKGTWRPAKNDPATEKQEVYLECLNSVAPPPLNWKMWCPGTDAKVVGWQDKSGAAHRQITLRPQAGMTSTMYQWFITTTVMGLMPPIVEFEGNHYHYYHLWHPLDHVESTWTMAPKVPILQKGPPVYVLIHERYRNPANFTHDRHYETNGWFYVDSAVSNLMKNRYVITMPYMGIPTWTMILEFNDTPEGLVVDVEVIAGVPHKGYDDRAPHDGYRHAAGMNELFTAPLLAKQKGSYDWDESINAITRHVIEEFSNLQHFVPYLYEKCNLLGKAGINWVPTLGTWLQNNNKTADSASVSFYHALEELAQKQVIKNGTLHSKLVDAQISVLNKTFTAGVKALTVTNEQLSRKTFVPLSNRLTKMSYEMNKASGAHPEVDVTVQSVKRGVLSRLLEGANITTETIITGPGGVTYPAAAGPVNSSAQVPAQQQDDDDDDDDEDGDAQAAQAAQAAKPQAKAIAGKPALKPAAAADAQRVPMTPSTAPATPAPAPAATPKAPKAAEEADDGADDEEDDEDAGSSSTGSTDDDDSAKDSSSSSGNSALSFRKQMTSDSFDPASNADAAESSAAGGILSDLKAISVKAPHMKDDSDDGAESGRLNSEIFVPYMDQKLPHLAKAAALGAILQARTQPPQAAADAQLPAAEAIEVSSVSLANITHTIRSSGSGYHSGEAQDAVDTSPPSTAANVTGLLKAVKQDIVAGLLGGSISFSASNSTIFLHDHVLAALAAKHALHKGVLSALLNNTEVMGSNVSVVGLPAVSFGGAASHGANSTRPEDILSGFVSKKAALLKGGGLAALQALNGSAGGGGGVRSVTIPHHVFTSLSNLSDAAGGVVTINASLLAGQPAPGSKGSLRDSLQRLGESVKTATRVAKSFKPALSLTPRGGAGGNGTAPGGLALKVKFWQP